MRHFTTFDIVITIQHGHKAKKLFKNKIHWKDTKMAFIDLVEF
jgi:hypothetical protein